MPQFRADRLFCTRCQDRIAKPGVDILLERTLIALEGENIVAALLDDLGSNLRLCTHRLYRDDGVVQIKQLQHLGNYRDLVTLAPVGLSGFPCVGGRLNITPPWL